MPHPSTGCTGLFVRSCKFRATSQPVDVEHVSFVGSPSAEQRDKKHRPARSEAAHHSNTSSSPRSKSLQSPNPRTPSCAAPRAASMDPTSGSTGAGGEPDAAEWRVRAAGGTEYSWCRAVPGGTGTTLLALHLTRGAAAAATLQAALRSLQNAHPVLRARLRASPSGPTLAFPSPSPPLPAPLPLAPLPAPESAPDFHALLEHELNRNPWAEPESSSDAPVLFATLYELPPPAAAAGAGAGGAALFIRIHTVACDRSAAVALAKELVALLGGGEEDGERAPEEAAAEAGLEERIPQRDTWKPFWARGMDMVGYSINGLRTSTLPFQETGTERSTQMLRLGFGRDETTRLLDGCKEHGVRLCAAMAAATMLAARQSKQLENGEQETYSIVTLVNCRKFLEPALDDHNIGFYYSAITNTHSVHGEEELWELAKRCHDSYTSAKNNKKHLIDISDLNFLMCRAIENPQLTPAAALRTALVSVFEEPVVCDMADLQSKAGVEDSVCCATVHGIGPSIGVFDSIRDGSLDCACMYPSPLHSRKQMQEVFDKVKQILHDGSHASNDEHFEDCT